MNQQSYNQGRNQYGLASPTPKRIVEYPHYPQITMPPMNPSVGMNTPPNFSPNPYMFEDIDKVSFEC